MTSASDTVLPVTMFSDMALSPAIFAALDDVGYETPSPIQAQAIPLLLQGRDVLGQAQTGTGKTAAFALPLLTRLDMAETQAPQILVLTPTRELAIQVAEAFQTYAAHIRGFHVLPVYGGQDYGVQIRALKRGVHCVVGTPGRMMDHMRRETLRLDALRAVVLDEADEMLRMGFAEDVEWILQHAPSERQTALFSATMPAAIRRIAANYLRDPAHITIAASKSTAAPIRQRMLAVHGPHKLEALTRVLESESFDAALVFVRTKTATVELAEKLAARGYAVAPLSGDVVQRQRERTVEDLRSGKLDIVVATDVAARGLDVERVSHVLNYDIPHDTEAYIHRIGRTGRAGKQGDAILFVTPRERGMLKAIERATKQPIEAMDLPAATAINEKRLTQFKQRVADAVAAGGLELYAKLVGELASDHGIAATDAAAALAKLLQGDEPLLVDDVPTPRAYDARRDTERPQRFGGGASGSGTRFGGKGPRPVEPGKIRYRVDVGRKHGVEPRNIVGAIANEAGIGGRDIGRIDILEHFSLIDLPDNLSQDVLRHLRGTWVAGQKLNLTPDAGPKNPKPHRKGGPPRAQGPDSTRPGPAKPGTGTKPGRTKAKAAPGKPGGNKPPKKAKKSKRPDRT